MNFLLNLSLVLAHTVVLEQRESDPHNLYRNGGDPPPTSVGESTSQQLQAYIQNLPALANATGAAMTPLAQAQQNATNATAPQQAALQTQLFGQYGPQLAAIGDTINANSASSNAASNVNLLNGSGGQAAMAADKLQRQLDPEYYATRALAGQKQQDLLNSIDLNGLSGSERAEVERSNNQSDASRGLLNAPSQTATVNNAMSFGNALNVKRNSLEQALSSATSFLPSSQGPVNGFQTATGKPSNSGTTSPTTFGNPNGGADTATSLGTSLLGGINSTATNNANISANRRDTLDRVNGTFSSLPNC